MNKITRKWLDINGCDEKCFITMEQYNSYNPKDLVIKNINTFDNGVKCAVFRYNTASRTNGMYMATAFIKKGELK